MDSQKTNCLSKNKKFIGRHCTYYTTVQYIKYTIGKYCLYNIISLQNITLQLPIVTKSTTLDVCKVFEMMKVRLENKTKFNYWITILCQNDVWLCAMKKLEIFLSRTVFRTKSSIYKYFFWKFENGWQDLAVNWFRKKIYTYIHRCQSRF